MSFQFDDSYDAAGGFYGDVSKPVPGEPSSAALPFGGDGQDIPTDKQSCWTTSTVEEEMQRRALLSASNEETHTMNPGGNHPASATAINGLTKGPIDFLDPRAENMCLVDIARGLSLTSRFFSQTLNMYTVAEHSCFTLDIFDALYPDATLDERRYCLLHDAHEGYFGDIGSPLKRAIEQLAGKAVIVEIESRLERQVLRLFGVPEPSIGTRQNVKRADLRARFCEGVRLCPGEDGWRTPDCEPPEGVVCTYGVIDWVMVEQLFLSRCTSLGLAEVQLQT